MNYATDFLIERLDQIEKTNLRLKILNAICLGVMIAFCSLPSTLALNAAPKAFSAEQFLLVSSTGKILAILGPGKKGGATLTFVDSRGRRIMSAGAFDDNSGDGLAMYDGNDIVPGKGGLREGVGMAVAPNPFPGIGASVFGPDAHLRVSWGAFPDGTNPGYATYDSNGVVRTFSGIEADPRFVGHYVLDATGAGRNGIQTDDADNFNGFFANDANGTNRVSDFAALDGSIAFSSVNGSAGPLGAQISQFVTGDGSFGDVNIADSSGRSRVNGFQAGSSQGVNTFDSLGNPSGSLP